MVKRKWRFVVFSLPVALTALYLSQQASAAPTDLENRLLGCVTDCASPEGRYAAILLLGYVRPSPDALRQREHIAQASTDPVAKVLSLYSLYKGEPSSAKRATAFVDVLQDEKVRKRLWSVATEETQYFNIIDFWGSLADITVYLKDPRALDTLFEMVPESDAGEAEYVRESIVSALVRRPEQTIRMMDEIKVNKAVLESVLSSHLGKEDASSLEQSLEHIQLQSPYRELIMEHIRRQ